MVDGFDPKKSKIGENALVTFIDEELSDDLMQVPGIGKEAVKSLSNCPDHIGSTYQLIGKFLMLKTKGLSEKEHCDKMWMWLKSVGINSHRSGIIRSLGLKLCVAYPNLFSDATFSVGSNAAEEVNEDS